jgi:hypothetical protein
MPHSLLNTNLRLLERKLQSLRDTAYFDRRVIDYIASLQKIVPLLVDPSVRLDERVKGMVGREIWRATEFIAGSGPRVQPYEMVYGLQCAVQEWFVTQANNVKPPLIVTSLIQEPNFYFQSVRPDFHAVLKDKLQVAIDYEIIQIKLPDLYRQKPLYSVALYHELGHFLDMRFEISRNVEVINPSLTLPSLTFPPGKIAPSVVKQIRMNHLREYFADLFGACYCGDAMKRFLEGFAPSNDASPTHPATYDRIQVIHALLTGTQHAVIDAFNLALRARSQPALSKRFERPDVTACFNMIRPVTLNSEAELHGIMDSAWAYLHSAADKKTEPWSKLDDLEIERVVNDLVVKSIRNRMILEQWNHAPVSA